MWIKNVLKPIADITKSVTSVFYDPAAKKYSSKRIAKLVGASVLIPSGLAMVNAGLVKLDIIETFKAGVVHSSIGLAIVVLGAYMGSKGTNAIENIVADKE